MKRRLSLCLLAVLLLLSLSVTAFAAQGDSNAKLAYVTDSYGLLSANEVSVLENRAREISNRYGFSTYIIVVDDYSRYLQSGSDIFDFAVESYEQYDLGWGNQREGISLVLSMNDRDYCLHLNSDRARAVFTEVGQDWMESRFLSYFGENDFYGGFTEYLDCCEEYLEAAANGDPIGSNVDANTEYITEEKSGGLGIFSAIPGAIAALFTGAAVKAPMRSAVRQTNANLYVTPGSLNLTQRSDHFLHRTVTRQARQTNQNRSSGGSGSVHHSSGSHSGRSGKF